MTFIQKQALWVSRDAEGNIVLHFPTSHVAYIEGAVATVNGTAPDENKNVTIDVGVKKVNDVAPDAEGNVAIEDYITGASINGKTITLNFKDGTSQTLTTQDTVPTDYVSNLSISGKMLTTTFKDGTTQTLQINNNKIGADAYGNLFSNIKVFDEDGNEYRLQIRAGVCGGVAEGYTNFLSPFDNACFAVMCTPQENAVVSEPRVINVKSATTTTFYFNQKRQNSAGASDVAGTFKYIAIGF